MYVNCCVGMDNKIEDLCQVLMDWEGRCFFVFINILGIKIWNVLVVCWYFMRLFLRWKRNSLFWREMKG